MAKRASGASRVGLLTVLLAFTACEATVGVKNVSIPRDAAHQCAVHCQSIGLSVTAVAIMAENVGCVCQYIAAAPQPGAPPPPVPPGPPAASDLSAGPLGTPVAGMATIAGQQAAAAALLAQQRTQQQQQQQLRFK